MREKQSKAMQGRHERMLEELLKQTGNERCADCQSRNPRWASYSLGVFLCIRCASLHRKMGTHISKVKSVTMDQWSLEQIQMMRSAGSNLEVNKIMNPHPENHPLPITQDDDFALEKYIRLKWEKRAFQAETQKVSTNVTPLGSFSTPLLGTGQERYSKQMGQLEDLGFNDRQRNADALTKTHGNLVMAIHILSNSMNVPQSTDQATIITNTMVSSPSTISELQEFSWTQSPRSTFVASITDTTSVSSMPSTPRIPQSTNPFHQEQKTFSTPNPFERPHGNISCPEAIINMTIDIKDFNESRHTNHNPFNRIDSTRSSNPFTQFNTAPNGFQPTQGPSFIANQPFSTMNINPWSQSNS